MIDYIEFKKILTKRYNQKCRTEKSKPRKDRKGNPILFHMSVDEYISVFEPYKDDNRLYVNFRSPERLFLCRKDDLGSYSVDNCYVDTQSNNSRLSYRYNILGEE